MKKFIESLDITQPVLKTNWEESDTIEFKKSLHKVGEGVDKDYLRTIVGFANNKGGVMIFGIEPESKELGGIKSEFENLDNRFFSTTVRLSTDGNFDFTFFTNNFVGNKIIGFLLVEEATSKPVLLKVDAGTVKHGEIYYRYPGVSAKINAGDLRKILNDEIIHQVNKTIGTFQKIVEYGNENIAILNTKTGEISSSENDLKLVMNESILNKLNLIKKGEIVQEEGSPAYVIKGEIEVEKTNTIEVVKSVPILITEDNILRDFFSGECEYPQTIIQQILHLNTYYLPVHFFVKSSGMTSEEGIEYITSIDDNNISVGVKNKVIERLKEYKYEKIGSLSTEINEKLDTNISIQLNWEQIIEKYSLTNKNRKMQALRSLIFNTLKSGISIPIEYYHTELQQRCVEAFSKLEKNVIVANKSFYLSELDKIKNLTMDSPTLSAYRKIVCQVDDWLYRN